MQKSALIEYKDDGYLCEGFAVWDDADAKRPGILVFPEWGGVGEYTHKRAQMLGETRYPQGHPPCRARADLRTFSSEWDGGSAQRLVRRGGFTVARFLRTIQQLAQCPR